MYTVYYVSYPYIYIFIFFHSNKWELDRLLLAPPYPRLILQSLPLLTNIVWSSYYGCFQTHSFCHFLWCKYYHLASFQWVATGWLNSLIFNKVRQKSIDSSLWEISQYFPLLLPQVLDSYSIIFRVFFFLLFVITAVKNILMILSLVLVN